MAKYALFEIMENASGASRPDFEALPLLYSLVRECRCVRFGAAKLQCAGRHTRLTSNGNFSPWPRI